jgi:hypothetical protein
LVLKDPWARKAFKDLPVHLVQEFPVGLAREVILESKV